MRISMNSSRIIVMIIVTTMIMLLISPVQSMPTRHKRWTFNTWRLHGRRYSPSEPTTEYYSPPGFADGNSQDPLTNVNYDDDDGNAYKMLLHLLQLFQTLEREQKQKGDGNKYF